MYFTDLEQKKSPIILDYWLKNEVKEDVKTSEKIPEKTYKKMNTFQKIKVNKK
jgi:hypothetical protein